MVRGWTRRLDNEHVFAANVLLDFDECLAVGKRRDSAFAHFDADVFTNGLRQRWIGSAAKNFHAASEIRVARKEKPASRVDFLVEL